MMRLAPRMFALALVALVAVRLGAAIPFPQVGSDLRPDPAAHFGTLPNGLRYVIMANHEPKERASLRLLVLAGSFQEGEAQRGLAHFLEHMAFNGSTHYAPGTLVERLQRLGMEFGADTNASTSFDHTQYILELPDTKPATLTEGLQILADYSGGLLIKPEMIDKERGIILSEKRARDSVAYRTFVAQAEFMEASTRVPQRLPIGLTEVIEKSGREPFVDFYNTWYRPELMTVVVVGDVDPAAIEKQISGLFSGIAARSPEPTPVDLGTVADPGVIKARFHSEPEAPSTQVVIASVTPFARKADNAAQRLQDFTLDLAIEMVNRRLAILAKKEKAPFTKAALSVEDNFSLYREARVDLVCKAEQWQAGIQVAEQQLRQALRYGFRPDELKEAAADFRNDLEQAVKSASTRRSEGLANQVVDLLVQNEVFTSPEDDLALFGPELARLTPAQCLSALRDAWKPQGRYVFVSGNAKIEGEADAAVAEAYKRSAAIAVVPSEALSRVIWAYSDFGKPGAIASRTHVDDLDFTEVVFENGVRLNVKKTDFEANTIHLAGRLGSGQLTEPAQTEPGLSAFTSLTYSPGGLGKHSADDLQRVLAGRNVGATLTSTLDSFVIEGSTNKEDLALEFELFTACLADPGYRPEALRQAQKRIESAYNRFQHTEGGPMALHVNRIVAGDDPRFGLPSKEEMMKRTLDEERAWLTPILQSGPLEVTVVGDLDVDAVIYNAARTLGNLPKRAPREPLDELRKVSFPKVPFAKDYGFDSQIPKSLVAVYWPTADGMDIRRARRLNILSQVLADRLRVKVREQLGSTYSPTVGSSASDVLPGYGYFAAVVIVEPAKAEAIEQVVVDVAADLCAHGVTQDELDRARNPALTAIKESERTNAYWMTALGRAQERPEVLDWARTRMSDFQAITKAEIDALASSYLAAPLASRVVIHPFAPAQPAGPQAPTPPPDGM